MFIAMLEQMVDVVGEDVQVMDTGHTIGDDLRWVRDEKSASGIPSLAKQFTSHLLDKHWAVLTPPHGETFYVSDSPVALNNLVDRGPRGNLGLQCEGIEIYLPLSHSLCLMVLDPLDGAAWRAL